MSLKPPEHAVTQNIVTGEIQTFDFQKSRICVKFTLFTRISPQLTYIFKPLIHVDSDYLKCPFNRARKTTLRKLIKAFLIRTLHSFYQVDAMKYSVTVS